MCSQESLFPFAARSLLPHKGPMCCIDRLLSSSKTAAITEADLHAEHVLLTDGLLDPAGCVELAAQTAGALQGFDQYKQGLPPKSGFLVGVQDFFVHGIARAGDTVRIEAAIIAELGEMTVLSARLFHQERLLAEGRLKVYVPE